MCLTPSGHHLNCEQLEYDGGDCADDARAEFQLDCLNQRAPVSWSGDGTCDNGIFQHAGVAFSECVLHFDV